MNLPEGVNYCLFSDSESFIVHKDKSYWSGHKKYLHMEPMAKLTSTRSTFSLEFVTLFGLVRG